jgi:NAD(P)H-dependent flavin oxidoreductase YrpB (nitropropane dioxygenase family)
MLGGVGVVSGTALEYVYSRLLQNGDLGGHIRRAFDELARRQPLLAESLSNIFNKYCVEGGKSAESPYKLAPIWALRPAEGPAGRDSFWAPAQEIQILTIAANFSEVWLAKEGHNGKVGINFLRKAERPLLWALYGAMLAGVDYVTVGAGNPAELPAIISELSAHGQASLLLKVHGAKSADGDFRMSIDPGSLVGPVAENLAQPRFLAIISSYTLAKALAENPATRPYGFIVEGQEAGGHNAPPGRIAFDNAGRQILRYTNEDRADIDAIAGLGLPFWLAGACATPECLKEALARGASGIQFGTAAALTGQSGMEPELRAKALAMLSKKELKVSNTIVSPTGFPFKVAQIPGTIADLLAYDSRRRICDIGYLQTIYLKEDGTLGCRCPSEPIDEFVKKGGRVQNTAGRACLCNALLASAGLAQRRAEGYIEPPIVTLGEDFRTPEELLAGLPSSQSTYTIGKLMLHLRKGLA